MPLRLLVIDAYSPNARQKLPDFGVTHAGTLLADTAKLHQPDAQVDVFNFDIEPDTTLPDPADYDGVMWTGSNMTIHRRNPLIDAQIEFAQQAFDNGTPQFGVC